MSGRTPDAYARGRALPRSSPNSSPFSVPLPLPASLAARPALEQRPAPQSTDIVSPYRQAGPQPVPRSTADPAPHRVPRRTVNRPSASREFDQMDRNNDGVVDRAEFNAAHPSASSCPSPAHYSPAPAAHYSPAGAAAARHSPALPAQDHLAINAPLRSFTEHTQTDAALEEAQRALLYASEVSRSIEQSQSPPRASSRSPETSERRDPGGQHEDRKNVEEHQDFPEERTHVEE